MILEKFYLKTLLLSLIVLNLVGGQMQTIKKTINLQPNE